MSGKQQLRQGIADRYHLNPSLHQNSTDAQDEDNNGSHGAADYDEDEDGTADNARAYPLVSPPGSGDSPFIYLRTRAAPAST